MVSKKNKISHSAVLVIDMINDYLTPDGAVYFEEGINLIPKIDSVCNFVRINGGKVVYVNTELEEGDILARKWGIHAVKGTKGSDVVDGLSPKEGDFIVKKKFYDGFFKTCLSSMLEKNDITTVVLTGIHTHVCVLLTGVGAFQNGFEVVALDDCFSTGYRPNHESRLRFFQSHLGVLTNSNDWMKSSGAV